MEKDDVTVVWEQIKKLSVKKKGKLVESDQWSFFDGIIYSLQEFTSSAGGLLYFVKEDEGGEKDLVLEIFHHEKIDGLNQTHATRNNYPLGTINFMAQEETQQTRNPFLYSILNNEVLSFDNIYDDSEFDFNEIIEMDHHFNFNTESFLIVPIKNHFDERVGVLALFNGKGADGKSKGYESDKIAYMEIFASLLGMSYTNYRLTNDLEKMFESFITVLAGAIDEKSDYTGHHCRQVPILAMMLGDALHEIDEGPLKDFHLTDSSRYQLELAALLHDCGKVTTPVHVMDKATKLETIYDRIDLVNTRFEIVMRDLEIRYLREKNKTPKDKHQALKVRYQGYMDQIRRDKRFLQDVNIGSEFMDNKKIVRVYEISKRYSWKDANGETQAFLNENEIKNLTVVKGTLTDEERKIINLHASVTIDMLNKIHFPTYLKRIPEMAVNHHEKMDGTGYPRGLKREEMSTEARLMGVVDVFEALTAGDRPYKKGKKLSEALFIMGKMKLDNHIDPDIFDAFIDKKVYLDYAKKYLSPEQIDLIDENKIPGYAPVHKRNDKLAA